jgi:glyoxylase I family protein
VHLTVHPPGSFRTSNIDNNDCHFAFCTDDFDDALATLTAAVFAKMRRRTTHFVFLSAATALPVSPQLYLLDPDRNIIEISGTA